MMSQRFHQTEPPNTFNTFMEKAGWSIMTIVCTMIATIAGLVWIGNIHILDFTWLMLILGIIMFAITIYSIWYSRRTRKIQQSKYYDDLAVLKREAQAFQDNFRDMVNQEFTRLNEWATNYTQTNAKEQAEHLKVIKSEYKQGIADAKSELTTIVQSGQTNLSNWIINHAEAHRLDKRDHKRQLEELEEKLTNKQLSETGN